MQAVRTPRRTVDDRGLWLAAPGQRAPVLTRAERRVSLLAAAGRTNHEIAAALHLSPKTVEWTLTRVYRKLGVRSRTELAARRGEPLGPG